MEAPSRATGTEPMEQYVERYSPENPAELAKTCLPTCVSREPPSEFEMRASNDRAEASALRASSILAFVSVASRSAQQRPKSPSCDPNSESSGSPMQGSSVVTRA